MLFLIAWRNIWRNKVRSLVIISSVVIGLWAGAFVNALYWGMGEDRVKIAVENEISHIQIHHPQFKQDYKAAFTIPVSDTLIHLLQSNSSIKAYSFRTIAQGMLATATGSRGLQINGVIPENENAVTHLGKKIIEGDYFPTGKKNVILVGSGLAKKMELKLRSKVVLTFLDKENNIVSAAFKVAGIFQTQNSLWDERNVFVRAEELNANLGLISETHEAAILLFRNNQLDSTLHVLKTALPALQVESWKEVAPEVSMIVESMSTFSTIFIVIILLALSFGIVNTMLMAVLERTRELAMMMALGMNKFKIFFMVLMETVLLVMIGCPIGLMIASASIGYFSKQGIDISSFSEKALSSYGMSSVIYPALPSGKYLEIVALVAVAALLSSLFPAGKALKLNIAESIKA